MLGANWSAGEPNSVSGGSCVAVAAVGAALVWSDATCVLLSRAVVEYEPSTPTWPATGVAGLGNGDTIFVFNTTLQSWSDAASANQSAPLGLCFSSASLAILPVFLSSSSYCVSLTSCRSVFPISQLTHSGIPARDPRNSYDGCRRVSHRRYSRSRHSSHTQASPLTPLVVCGWVLVSPAPRSP
jgi:hypothetical protein